MSATASSSETAPLRQRAQGSIAVSAVSIGGVSRAARVAESGAARLRIPRSEHGLEGVMLNVAGGLACGDRMRVDASVGPIASLSLSTPGAERVYRSDGPTTEVENRFTVGAGGRLAWLPQETILYDDARLSRRMEADVAEDGALTVWEALVFGRKARGETVRNGFLSDRWRVRRGEKLVFAETLRFDGAVEALLARKAVAAGATAIATLLHVAPDAESKLEAVREALDGRPVEAGVTAWNGLLVMRMLSPLSETLRDAARAVLPVLTARPLPRVWAC